MALAGARGASRSGSASIPTIHAPLRTEVECKIAPVEQLMMLPAAADVMRIAAWLLSTPSADALGGDRTPLDSLTLLC
jgi:hypothetical protein